jgi:hypothetical protein
VPIVRNYDPSFRQELAERVEYERWLLDFFRGQFFGQGEAPNSLTTFTIGHVNDRGELLTRRNLEFVTSISAQHVNDALARFRVLAFASAFKLQDGIAEWILEANGEQHWRFSEKLKRYDQLRKAGTLHEPPEFLRHPNVARAFWELFRKLEPPRGAVIHTGKLKIDPSGRIDITDRNNAVLQFDVRAQAAYVRFACLLSGILCGDLESSSYLEALIENDLAVLTPLHGVGFNARPIRFEAVRLYVPIQFATQRSPYACDIDLAPIRTHMELSSPVGAGGHLFLSFEVIAESDDHELVRQLPPEVVPERRLVLREDDPALQPRLAIRPKA